jgi:hypothetical protein
MVGSRADRHRSQQTARLHWMTLCRNHAEVSDYLRVVPGHSLLAPQQFRTAGRAADNLQLQDRGTQVTADDVLSQLAKVAMVVTSEGRLSKDADLFTPPRKNSPVKTRCRLRAC